jgi:hypothetical protein
MTQSGGNGTDSSATGGGARPTTPGALGRRHTPTSLSAAAPLPILTRRLAGLMIIAVPLLILHQLSGSIPVAETRRAQLLVDVPSVATLVEDTPAMEFLVRSGVSGILVQPSTLGGLLSGRDVTLATGAEILRLFRMESILNIWMWEQIKDKPVRLDATYVFTNQLILFERIFETLREQLGEDRVRTYRDESHDFGGQIPSNYIIEVMAPPEELLTVTIGLDRAWRDSLMPVVAAGRAEDIVDLPREVPAILVTENEAAGAAFARLRPTRVYLAPGVTNPGWNQARTALRFQADSGAIDADVVVCSLPDVTRAAAALKQKGYAIGVASLSARNGEEQLRAEARRLWWWGLFADLALACGAAALAGIAFSGLPRGVWAAILAASAVAALAPLLPFFGDRIPAGLAAILIAAFAPVVAVRRFESRELFVWKTIAVFCLLLLAARARAFPIPVLPLTVSCAALAAYTAHGAGRRRVDRFLLAASLVAAGGLLPTHSWALLAAAGGAGLLFVAGYDRRAAVAAALAAWPAALAASLEPARPLTIRIFLLLTVVVSSLLPAARKRPQL